MITQKGNVALIVILVVVFLAISGAYYFGRNGTQTPQIYASPSPTIRALSNQPAADQTANWQTYNNAQVGFSIQYPQDWVKKDISSNGQIYSEDLTGKEGEVRFTWGNGFGGGCPQGEAMTWVDVAIQGEILKACYSATDNKEMWSAMGKVLPNITVKTDASANSPASINRATILKILATLKFTN